MEVKWPKKSFKEITMDEGWKGGEGKEVIKPTRIMEERPKKFGSQEGG